MASDLLFNGCQKSQFLKIFGWHKYFCNLKHHNVVQLNRSWRELINALLKNIHIFPSKIRSSRKQFDLLNMSWYNPIIFYVVLSSVRLKTSKIVMIFLAKRYWKIFLTGPVRLVCLSPELNEWSIRVCQINFDRIGPKRRKWTYILSSVPKTSSCRMYEIAIEIIAWKWYYNFENLNEREEI